MKKPPPPQPPTVAIALFVALGLFIGFVALIAVVLPGILLMVLAGIGMTFFFALQYFLWARWMFPIVQRWEREAEARLQQQDSSASDK